MLCGFTGCFCCHNVAIHSENWNPSHFPFPQRNSPTTHFPSSAPSLKTGWITCNSGSMAKEFIRIGGAREHNLKNLTLNIPRDKLVVITGLSGSGKSSLAFDTIYAEGQRKYVESLSAYARQFLDQMQKPEVDFI